MKRTNRIFRWAGVVAGLTLGVVSAPSAAHAQISVVVAASSARTANQDAVARMFSGQTTSWPDGSKVQLVDQSGTQLGQQFYNSVLGKSPAQVRKALTALLLSGQIPSPEQANSDADVKAAVARLPDAVGYISSASLDDTVKEIARIE